ncbi:MAG: peptide chain release factor N(5)-glutamine methyltransferase [Ignavibacteriales bacterium]|nr:peptide chain release factor N(5)-glutamine methyltransferase [Ignavibacteriales bacterium]
MYSILQIIELSAEYLNTKGVESPRLNAELLLANLLNCKRLDLYLKYDQPLKEIEINKYRELIARRGKREPLQYIIGNVEFYGLNFSVNPNVLIPRQETEILVDQIISNIDKNTKVKILDIGTGSGNIPIALAKNLPNVEIVAIDISGNAIAIAKFNSERNNVSDRINFINSDFNKYLISENHQFDIIVSNPPYIKMDEYNLLEKELTDFEPNIALTDFNDGLTFYRNISEKSKSLLKSNGQIYFEVGISQSGKVKEILENNNFSNIKLVKDYLEIERVVYGDKN